MTDTHEMRMVNGRICAVYLEDGGAEYRIIDGEVIRCPTQEDMTDEDVESLDS